MTTLDAVASPEADQWEQEEQAFQTRIASIASVKTASQRWLVLIALTIACGLEVGAKNALNILLTDMQGNIAASLDEISWVITVYNAGYLCGLALSVYTARRLGGRGHIFFALALFSLGAGGCYLSSGLAALLVSRFVMGFGGGFFIVRTQVFIYQLYPGPAKSLPLVVFGVGVCGIKAVLPVMMAWLTDAMSWHVAFLLLIPPSLGAAALVAHALPHGPTENERHPHPDVPSVAILLLALCCLQFVASRGEQLDWFGSDWIVAALALIVIASVGFIVRQLRPSSDTHIMSLHIVRDEPSLIAGAIVAFMLGVFLAAGLYVLPQYLRGTQSYSATQTSLFFALDGIATLAGVPIFGRLLPRLKASGVILVALVILLSANLFFVFGLTPSTPGFLIAFIVTLHGLGLGLYLPAAGNLVLSKMKIAHIHDGAAAYLFVRQLGSTIGVTGATVLIDWRMTLHSSRILDTANRLTAVTRSTLNSYEALLSRANPAHTSPIEGSYQLFQSVVIGQTRLLAFIDVFAALTALSCATAVVVLVQMHLMHRPEVHTSVSSG